MESYYQSTNRATNKLLVRFLMAASIVFLVVVAITYWRQQNVTEVAAPIIVPKVANFYDFASTSEITKAYAFNSKVVHDLESYPEIKSLFFSAKTNFIKDQSIRIEALARIREAQKETTDFSDKHVYHTSFYVGNVLVLPDITLHALLLQIERPGTSVLLETALADVRAGVVKLQDYFGLPTPSQLDSTITSKLYFKTPSFPNLTTAEVLTVLYLLAEVDPTNSRLYEMHAHQYISHVLQSGGVFDFDVEYAIDLVSVYYQIFKQNEYYQGLIEKAKAEWLDSVLATGTLVLTPKYELKDFPHQSNFSVERTDYGYKVPIEELAGSLMLSLIDERLPDPHSTLYEYSFKSEDLLPSATNLNKRIFPTISNGVSFASYSALDRFVFVSGEVGTLGEVTDSNSGAETSIFYYHKGNLIPLSDSVNEKSNLYTRLDPVLSSDSSLVLWSQKILSTKDEWEVVLSQISGDLVLDTEILTNGEYPHFVFANTGVVYLKDNNIYHYSIAKKTVTKIADLAINLQKGISIGLGYNSDQEIGIVRVASLNEKTLFPETNIYLYQLNSKMGSVEAKLVSQIKLNDALASSISLSPGGQYLAMTMTETTLKRSSRVLIYDIMNGIIKKEIPLEPFRSDFMFLDTWSLFN